jgi:hypothetical protein
LSNAKVRHRRRRRQWKRERWVEQWRLVLDGFGRVSDTLRMERQNLNSETAPGHELHVVRYTSVTFFRGPGF